MFKVSGRHSRFTFHGPRTSALASVHSTPVAVGHSRVLARCALPRFRKTPLARPLRPEPRTPARIDEFFAVD